jgi:hypothetical protein
MMTARVAKYAAICMPAVPMSVCNILPTTLVSLSSHDVSHRISLHDGTTPADRRKPTPWLAMPAASRTIIALVTAKRRLSGICRSQGSSRCHHNLRAAQRKACRKWLLRRPPSALRRYSNHSAFSLGLPQKRKRPVLFPGRVSSCVSLAHVAMIACIAFTPNELVNRPMEAPLGTTRSYRAAIRAPLMSEPALGGLTPVKGAHSKPGSSYSHLAKRRVPLAAVRLGRRRRSL